MANFADIAERLTAAGAALEVANEAALADAVDALLTDAPRRHDMAKAARDAAAAEADSLDAVLAELEPFLDFWAQAGRDDHAGA
jgi:3-deoxy-D-manno-octulosonic-acid transferase